MTTQRGGQGGTGPQSIFDFDTPAKKPTTTLMYNGPEDHDDHDDAQAFGETRRDETRRIAMQRKRDGRD